MPASPPDDLLDELPPAARETFARVYPETAPASAGPLLASVQRHLEEARRAARANEFVDTSLADAIADRLRQVLAGWDTLTAPQRAAVSATVSYFALSDDAEDDLDSVLGFEDDAHVFNACARFLGRPDLQIAPE